MTTSDIRVLLIAADPLRARLAACIRRMPGLELVGEAGDGAQAVTLARRLNPAVVAIDGALGESGPAAVTLLMATFPLPILALTADPSHGLLEAGAVDHFDCSDDATLDRKFASALRVVSRVPVVRRKARGTAELALPDSPAGANAFDWIAIGASTGGPPALAAILKDLDPGYPLPILVVLHVDATFSERFVEWLSSQTRLAVALARDGEVVAGPGRVLVAPPDRHLEVRHGRVRLSDGPELHACKPAVDVLFESLAGVSAPRTIACLLTGMGRDGAAGLASLRKTGALTIVQDEATSAVFGMPREAIRLGAAEHILPLDRIAPMLKRLATEGRALRSDR